jgi:predicted 3-demethylubiquinone-9 3-methyltransferase (glyoxalase superfamily)
MSVTGPTPCLWFNDTAEYAAKFYVEKLGGTINAISRYGDGATLPVGTALMVAFEILGTPYAALNGGSHFQLTPAISLVLKCDSQAEIDTIWNVLADGGTPSQCGWITDRFGVSWQVVPSQLAGWMTNDTEAAARVTKAIMPMVKLDIATLEVAFEARN